jgi:protein SCO1/2
MASRAERVARLRQQDRQRLVLGVGGVAVLLLMAGAFTWLLPQSGAGTQSARVGGPFSLVADDGRSVTERSFPDKYKLVYFGYSSCRDVCPSTLNTLGAAVDRLGAAGARVQPLFITVDPARDTPAVLRRYVHAFGGHLLGLTGQPDELRKAAREYGVVTEPSQDAGSGDIDHSSVIYMMAPDGRFVAPIPAGASEMVMAQAIARRLQ